MRTRSLFIPLLAAIALTACTSPAASPSPPVPSAAPPSQSPTASPGESSPATGSATVVVADSPLGKIVVDGAGKTLYAFTPDSAGAPTCYDACATNWPPLLASGDITVGAGLDDSDFSTVARTDSGNQVKFYTQPLYYYSGDAAAGETKGQGLFGKWYVVSPTGALIK